MSFGRRDGPEQLQYGYFRCHFLYLICRVGRLSLPITDLVYVMFDKKTLGQCPRTITLM